MDNRTDFEIAISNLVRYCVAATANPPEGANHKIAAIKLLRQIAGFDLKSSKDLVEAALPITDPVVAVLRRGDVRTYREGCA